MGIAAMGIAAILAAITFGPMEGVRAAQNQPQAKAEPAAMAQALERFKRHTAFIHMPKRPSIDNLYLEA